MEILAELLFFIFRVIAEIALQIIFEALAELGIRSMREPFRKPRPLHPVLATIGYLLFGAVAGGMSLWILPESFIDHHGARVANLIVTPLIAGAAMAALGAWRRRRNQELVRLDRFSYGYVFAFAMTLVRLVWAANPG